MSGPTRRWVGTSWKMTKSRAEAEAWARRVGPVEPPVGVVPFVMPGFTMLDLVRDALGTGTAVRLGAQNGHWADAGPWTGEVAMPMLVEAGVSMVEIGHAERRAWFGETDHTVALKVTSAQRHGLIPVICVGEPAEVRAAGRSTDFVIDQIAAALADAPTPAEAVIAYEPVWAIGAEGRRPEPGELVDVFDAVARRWPVGEAIAGVLYGGSVDVDNAAELLGVPGCDGLFVGRGAARAEDFERLVEIAGRA
ncbi:triose-phosphate isomerase [Naumannella cuiyingiana]|uniref:Triosephosphate isomerase n=1 Tax=Naumannella cuiyingiana TaxID=1347891 RepID=A0A7Z0D9I9_9ACTN|nr:triosephosphate isomerase [Naumannella cuiyingiana]